MRVVSELVRERKELLGIDAALRLLALYCGAPSMGASGSLSGVETSRVARSSTMLATTPCSRGERPVYRVACPGAVMVAPCS